MAATCTKLCGNCVLVGSQLFLKLHKSRKVNDSHTNYGCLSPWGLCMIMHGPFTNETWDFKQHRLHSLMVLGNNKYPIQLRTKHAHRIIRDHNLKLWESPCWIWRQFYLLRRRSKYWKTSGAKFVEEIRYYTSSANSTSQTHFLEVMLSHWQWYWMVQWLQCW